jgi:hypothetical protein
LRRTVARDLLARGTCYSALFISRPPNLVLTANTCSWSSRSNCPRTLNVTGFGSRIGPFLTRRPARCSPVSSLAADCQVNSAAPRRVRGGACQLRVRRVPRMVLRSPAPDHRGVDQVPTEALPDAGDGRCSAPAPCSAPAFSAARKNAAGDERQPGAPSPRRGWDRRLGTRSTARKNAMLWAGVGRLQAIWETTYCSSSESGIRPVLHSRLKGGRAIRVRRSMIRWISLPAVSHGNPRSITL